jgi:ribosomal protein L13
VINAEKVKFTGNKLKQQTYYKHTGYAGGLKEVTADKVLAGRFPERVLEKAVERMIPVARWVAIRCAPCTCTLAASTRTAAPSPSCWTWLP